jgi:hypothetical protein
VTALKAIAAITLVLLAFVVALIACRSAIFEAYSRDFGSLSPVQFESMNARMDLLDTLARFSLVGLASSDVVLLVLAIRNRAYVALGLAIALAVALALFFVIAQLAVGPTMIGSREAGAARMAHADGCVAPAELHHAR